MNAILSINPTATLNLPASLVEDLLDTSVGDLSLIDQARVDAVNSVSPLGANEYVLNQLGQQFGIPQGQGSNARALVVFSGTVGYVIPAGFLVSDGTTQYAVQGGTIIESSGSSPPVTVIATNPNVYPVLANTIIYIVSSVSGLYNITVTNPLAGTPAQPPQTVASYRSQLLQAGQAGAVGTLSYLRTQLQQIPGVNPLWVSVIQKSTGLEVICGGGDSYAVANAILNSVLNPAVLLGSSVSSTRNVNVSIVDDPDTYSIVYVAPPSQIVTMTVTWNTTLANFTGGTVVQSLAVPALAAFINAISVGQPINVLGLQEAFQQAVASILSASNLTTLTFSVSINGTITPPNSGTSIIVGDPESYFTAANSGITVTQG
ncbi:MAG: baseplate J/gp47 family protein [Acidobacteriaceae bacterium]